MGSAAGRSRRARSVPRLLTPANWASLPGQPPATVTRIRGPAIVSGTGLGSSHTTTPSALMMLAPLPAGATAISSSADCQAGLPWPA